VRKPRYLAMSMPRKAKPPAASSWLDLPEAPAPAAAKKRVIPVNAKGGRTPAPAFLRFSPPIALVTYREEAICCLLGLRDVIGTMRPSVVTARCLATIDRILKLK